MFAGEHLLPLSAQLSFSKFLSLFLLWLDRESLFLFLLRLSPLLGHNHHLNHSCRLEWRKQIPLLVAQPGWSGGEHPFSTSGFHPSTYEAVGDEALPPFQLSVW